MFRSFLVLMLSLISAGCLAVGGSNNATTCSGHALGDIYSSYVVFDIVKYGGGLTTESSAQEHIGEPVLVYPNKFQVRDFVISNPSYELECYPVPEEGEIDVNRWSNFYGFGLDRTSINVLHVYDEGDAVGEASINLELVNGQLWEMYDGWIYKMKAPEGRKPTEVGK
ncbi:hypothetical protein [Marinobacter nitratireducens]|uniref:hypothetical protein n=1 Tax=Marinobacter nitratireducens TaxID=1137280 RepID=UPI00055EAD30|nr:hypothetical protein [Marinobacter nitratireducens]